MILSRSTITESRAEAKMEKTFGKRWPSMCLSRKDTDQQSSGVIRDDAYWVTGHNFWSCYYFPTEVADIAEGWDQSQKTLFAFKKKFFLCSCIGQQKKLIRCATFPHLMPFPFLLSKLFSKTFALVVFFIIDALHWSLDLRVVLQRAHNKRKLKTSKLPLFLPNQIFKKCLPAIIPFFTCAYFAAVSSL